MKASLHWRSTNVVWALVSSSMMLGPRAFLVTTPTRQSGRRLASVGAAVAKRVLVPIADGSEEIETSCISDTLVRAGAAVTVASANADGSTAVTMSRGLKILADTHVRELDGKDWDLVAIPGGMPGAANLAASPELVAILKAQAERKKPLAAVCASPAVVLKPLGLLDDKPATCYPAPAFQEALGDGLLLGKDVVVSDNVVTSRGPGTSLNFALTLVETLYGPDKKTELANQMLVAAD
mmetsp:Transcript_36308/g.116335  ORF Transcript_36308/g.116335 Transcript_36308/m.116335 type:complete len:238 (+) Transcript_36308:1-714(+)|eukprot:CAMPEP_0118896342 /NCGR_PEP_ID=MMETSP1166-20130328/4258_1 /TAXON_ID=1104430 /ORGANISM="Chrysoreinhardia sp, Strain CCMP3193" /LENGTH=237 /DNA_ID=CAMNT_0006835399 /DNA_START=1 /DNA_END=714 /DNA_ORIENTATION=+